jgi:hypothetical protein
MVGRCLVLGLVGYRPVCTLNGADESAMNPEVYRILRDTLLARTLKEMYQNQCQVCGESLQLSDSTAYSEAHHIKPLGKPLNGPDIAANILVLCPNHHVLCDYGALRLDFPELHHHPDHLIGAEFVNYHNEAILKDQ